MSQEQEPPDLYLLLGAPVLGAWADQPEPVRVAWLELARNGRLPQHGKEEG